MEINELRIFRAVAQEGSITRAAQVLGYVQSNVTARVQQLEAELNKQLFYRQRGMVLTPAGKKLLDYSERILHLLDEANKALNDTPEPEGRLSLGAYHTVSYLHLPELLTRYHVAYPRVELSLLTESSAALAEKVLHYQLDCAFVMSPLHDDHIVEELVREDELLLIASPGNNIIDDVYRQPFLMNTKGCLHRERLETWLKLNGIISVLYMEFNHLEAIIRGVMAGLGASLVPRSAVEKLVEAGQLRAFAIPQEFGLIQTYLIRHKDCMVTSALAKFMEMLKESPEFFIEKGTVRSEDP
ncbi:LysR family transcriptional regulator [Brevibacillus migulae]|uniref:LysR family transcriptional regulator n=1 Tax=Brevibacillus migulae TaxID=1644114 RepID=UPI00106EA521|nr:LysR family transcriptional regulator [Brevibacillus migulae]